jgi:hypothetical protein
MLVLSIISIIISLFLLAFSFRKLATIGNVWLQVADSKQVKNNTKYEYTKLTVKYIRFYIIIIIGVVAINWLFVYAITHPEILK